MTRWAGGERPGGEHYDEAFNRLAADGVDVHGEADFVAEFAPERVLDAGCGTGRVAIELRRRGIEVIGVDLDPSMLDAARAKDPGGRWLLADLSQLELGDLAPPEGFDIVVAAGNVMIFLEAGTETAAVAALARHLAPGGRLITGFQLGTHYDLSDFDADCRSAGLTFDARYSTWDRQPFAPGGDYAVSVHRA